jgi:probable O-glycosylation ligase (exosortase A-associated)
MRALLVLAIVAGWLLPAIRSPFHAFLLYVWFSVFQAHDWSWGALGSLRLSMLLGLVLVVPSMLRLQFPNVTHPLSIGALLFVGVSLVAQQGAVDAAAGWNAIDLLSTMVLVALFGVSLTTTRERALAQIGVIGASLGLHAAYSGFAVATRGGQLLSGLGGVLGDNNSYALAMVRVIYLIVAMVQNTTRSWVRIAYAVALPFCLVGVVATFSRGAFVALAVSLTAFVFLQRRRLLGVVALAGIATVGALLVPEGYEDRIGTVGNFEEERSAQGRVHFWQVAIEMVKDRPFGVGLGNYEWAYDQYDFSGGDFGYGRAVHSIHFQALAETGYLGFAIFEWLLFYSLWVAFKVRSRAKRDELPAEMRHFLFTSANALIASMIAFIVGGSFLSQALNDLNWLTFSLAAALDLVSRDALAAAQAPAPGPGPAPVAAPAIFPAPLSVPLLPEPRPVFLRASRRTGTSAARSHPGPAHAPRPSADS